jgi:hypothetical protein
LAELCELILHDGEEVNGKISPKYYYKGTDFVMFEKSWHPLTNIEQAMMVLSKFRCWEFHRMVGSWEENTFDENYMVIIWLNTEKCVNKNANAPSEAICLAAIAALEDK